MEAVEMTDTNSSLDNAMNILLTKLDEAIDDMENGRVLSEEEVWENLDTM